MATNQVIEARTAEEFQEKMNEVNRSKNVFATQTHVTPVSDGLLYTAVFFIKE
jgi:hypothetical protein